jgi:hypothetical protein
MYLVYQCIHSVNSVRTQCFNSYISNIQDDALAFALCFFATVVADSMLAFASALLLCDVPLAGPAPCTQSALAAVCDAEDRCHPDNAACPPVTTEQSCGEIPHSGRDGKVLTFGVGYRAASAQECCDRCKGDTRGCNSWTFCGLPVCWGLDTGWNHTYGECWLRRLNKSELRASRSFRQRGKYTAEWLGKHRRARPGCKTNAPWACSPTHVPWTSGAIGGPPHDPAASWVTGGGWGNVWVKPGTP